MTERESRKLIDKLKHPFRHSHKKSQSSDEDFKTEHENYQPHGGLEGTQGTHETRGFDDTQETSKAKMGSELDSDRNETYNAIQSSKYSPSKKGRVVSSEKEHIRIPGIEIPQEEFEAKYGKKLGAETQGHGAQELYNPHNDLEEQAKKSGISQHKNKEMYYDANQDMYQQEDYNMHTKSVGDTAFDVDKQNTGNGSATGSSSHHGVGTVGAASGAAAAAAAAALGYDRSSKSKQNAYSEKDIPSNASVKDANFVGGSDDIDDELAANKMKDNTISGNGYSRDNGIESQNMAHKSTIREMDRGYQDNAMNTSGYMGSKLDPHNHMNADANTMPAEGASHDDDMPVPNVDSKMQPDTMDKDTGISGSSSRYSDSLKQEIMGSELGNVLNKDSGTVSSRSYERTGVRAGSGNTNLGDGDYYNSPDVQRYKKQIPEQQSSKPMATMASGNMMNAKMAGGAGLDDSTSKGTENRSMGMEQLDHTNSDKNDISGLDNSGKNTDSQEGSDRLGKSFGAAKSKFRDAGLVDESKLNTAGVKDAVQHGNYKEFIKSDSAGKSNKDLGIAAGVAAGTAGLAGATAYAGSKDKKEADSGNTQSQDKKSGYSYYSGNTGTQGTDKKGGYSGSQDANLKKDEYSGYSGDIGSQDKKSGYSDYSGYSGNIGTQGTDLNKGGYSGSQDADLKKEYSGYSGDIGSQEKNDFSDYSGAKDSNFKRGELSDYALYKQSEFDKQGDMTGYSDSKQEDEDFPVGAGLDDYTREGDPLGKETGNTKNEEGSNKSSPSTLGNMFTGAAGALGFMGGSSATKGNANAKMNPTEDLGARTSTLDPSAMETRRSNISSGSGSIGMKNDRMGENTLGQFMKNDLENHLGNTDEVHKPVVSMLRDDEGTDVPEKRNISTNKSDMNTDLNTYTDKQNVPTASDSQNSEQRSSIPAIGGAMGALGALGGFLYGGNHSTKDSQQSSEKDTGYLPEGYGNLRDSDHNNQAKMSKDMSSGKDNITSSGKTYDMPKDMSSGQNKLSSANDEMVGYMNKNMPSGQDTSGKDMSLSSANDEMAGNYMNKNMPSGKDNSRMNTSGMNASGMNTSGMNTSGMDTSDTSGAEIPYRKDISSGNDMSEQSKQSSGKAGMAGVAGLAGMAGMASTMKLSGNSDMGDKDISIKDKASRQFGGDNAFASDTSKDVDKSGSLGNGRGAELTDNAGLADSAKKLKTQGMDLGNTVKDTKQSIADKSILESGNLSSATEKLGKQGKDLENTAKETYDKAVNKSPKSEGKGSKFASISNKFRRKSRDMGNNGKDSEEMNKKSDISGENASKGNKMSNVMKESTLSNDPPNMMQNRDISGTGKEVLEDTGMSSLEQSNKNTNIPGTRATYGTNATNLGQHDNREHMMTNDMTNPAYGDNEFAKGSSPKTHKKDNGKFHWPQKFHKTEKSGDSVPMKESEKSPELGKDNMEGDKPKSGLKQKAMLGGGIAAATAGLTGHWMHKDQKDSKKDMSNEDSSSRGHMGSAHNDKHGAASLKEKSIPDNKFTVEVIGTSDKITAKEIAVNTTNKLNEEGVDLTSGRLVINTNTNEVYKTENGEKTFSETLSSMKNIDTSKGMHGALASEDLHVKSSTTGKTIDPYGGPSTYQEDTHMQKGTGSSVPRGATHETPDVSQFTKASHTSGTKPQRRKSDSNYDGRIDIPAYTLQIQNTTFGKNYVTSTGERRSSIGNDVRTEERPSQANKTQAPRLPGSFVA